MLYLLLIQNLKQLKNEETLNDPDYKSILEEIEYVNESLSDLCEYSLQNECLFRGMRVTIPKTL